MQTVYLPMLHLGAAEFNNLPTRAFTTLDAAAEFLGVKASELVKGENTECFYCGYPGEEYEQHYVYYDHPDPKLWEIRIYEVKLLDRVENPTLRHIGQPD